MNSKSEDKNENCSNQSYCDINDPIECECHKNFFKCHNYKLCQIIESKDVLDSHDGLCVYCHIIHGKLNLEENNDEDEPCSLCLIKMKIRVNFLEKCKHYICVDCCKKKFMFNENDRQIFEVCSICLNK